GGKGISCRRSGLFLLPRLIGHRLFRGFPDRAHGRSLLLLIEMPDEPGTAGDQAETARDFRWHTAVAENSRDRAGGVDGDVATVDRIDCAAQRFDRRDMLPGDFPRARQL